VHAPETWTPPPRAHPFPALPSLTAGDELERRFKAGEAVYEEDMLHRPPGAAAGAAAAPQDVEEGFGPAASWLEEEVGPGRGGKGGTPAACTARAVGSAA
jgi:hypothetical protein